MKIKTIEYQTARDLPFTKAGSEVNLMSKGCVPVSIFDFRGITGSVPNVDVAKDHLDYLISEGWIEPIKPREWWVNMHKDSGNNYFCNTKDEAIRTMWGVPEHNHIIKVREVIE